ncbi:MAG: glycine cleavage system aminomethyltransferase GcvT [Rhodobacteraceae bacterium]|nr:glycine cleavage system aminomethyltransferase GcvT [Paracoccaceae bacterium]
MADHLSRLVLHDLHLAQGARMGPFAGHDMPLHYAKGVLAEHLHCRAKAGLFDVSHMGQILLRPKAGMVPLALGLETLMPVDVLGLPEGRQRYGFLTNDAGGIIDDVIFANRGDHVLMVVNGANRQALAAHLRAHLAGVAEVDLLADRALLALQGPMAERVLTAVLPEVAEMRFMDIRALAWRGAALWVARSGYTGEDGFEISVPGALAEEFVRDLLAHPYVALVGLGARDSLRLEAGLCLHGHDIGPDTTPVEAALGWAIPSLRRAGGARAGGFPGATVIMQELATGPERLRVGLVPQGRAPLREGVAILSADGAGPVGHVTSGGYGPSCAGPIAMGYVPRSISDAGRVLPVLLRGKELPVTVTRLPFHPTRYKR